MQCHTDDVIGQIYNVTDPWPDTHIWLVYLPWTHKQWPSGSHGTEWQCGNSTLAMSWTNHVEILSFAAMASRQGAVKHGFVSKIAGGCSSYDVIAPWPDLTWSFFLPKVAQGLPHKVPQNPAFSAKNLRGGGGVALSGRELTSKLPN